MGLPLVREAFAAHTGKAPSGRTIRVPVAAACFALFAASAWAAPIAVNNPSFEALPTGGLSEACGTGCSYSIDFVPGWLNTPYGGLGLNSGQFRPGTDAGNTTWFSSLSDGPTSAYTSIGCIEQTIGATVQVGVTYTLVVDVGWRWDAGPGGVPRLRVNDLYYDGVGTRVQGGWAPFTATYVGRAEDAGLPITICLNSVSFQGNFDNVRFDDSNPTTDVDLGSSTGAPQLVVRSNPFVASTQFRFRLESDSPVTLRVHDALGRVVRTLLSGSSLGAGVHEVAWSGTDDAGSRLSAGLYFVRVETRQGGQTARVIRVQ